MDFSGYSYRRALNIANSEARKSCSNWNYWGPLDSTLGKFSRRRHRRKYRAIAESFAAMESCLLHTQPQLADSRKIDTYPWPYCDHNFAYWAENDDARHYTLISDPSGFAIRHSTSYCAWKICEATGHWPRRVTPRRFDAKDWLRTEDYQQGFLPEAGFYSVRGVPEPGSHYVGINPEFGEFGTVVWYEGPHPDYGYVYLSTYRNGEYFFGYDDWNSYLWVYVAPDPSADIDVSEKAGDSAF